jgi:hypothetical protein
VALIAAELTAPGAPIAVVDRLAGVLARFVWVNVNGPPNAPVVIFRTVTVACVGVLVSTHLMRAAETTFAAGMVSTLPEKLPKLAGLPETAEFVSVQEIAVSEKAKGFSVTVTAVFNVVTLIAVGAAGVAVATAVVVIAAGADARLLTVKVNGPPVVDAVCFWSAKVAGIAALVNVQVCRRQNVGGGNGEQQSS